MVGFGRLCPKKAYYAFSCAHFFRKYAKIMLLSENYALCHLNYATYILRKLSGSLPKSGPLDFGTKNNFPSFFVSEKGLVHISKKSNLLFSNFLFLLRYEPKLYFGRT